MIIQHNLSSMNSWRNTKLNNSGIAKSLEKLSSGFRVNHAADDAAGLAISEKMRGQIRGLTMGTQNTNMGVNLIQTAEGGLDEVHSILQRMRELAVQSSNGTYQDDDRILLDKEFQALKSEVDRIANSTHYNGINLLNMSNEIVNSKEVMEYVKVSESKLMVYQSYSSREALTSYKDALQNATFNSTNSSQTYFFSSGPGNSTQIAFNIEQYILADDANYSQSFGDFLKNDLFEADGTINSANADFFAQRVASALEIGFADHGYTGLTVTGSITSDGRVAFSVDFPPNAGFYMGGCSAIPPNGFGHYFMHMACKSEGTPIDTGVVTEYWDWRPKTETESVIEKCKLWIQSGANSGDGMYVELCDSRTPALGIDKSAVDPLEAANEAIGFLDRATNIVSSYRASFGASQNRLESAVRSNGTATENLQAAESSIRDLDMAKEMMSFTKDNILVQASQSMLAQANQLPQGVLNLLKAA